MDTTYEVHAYCENENCRDHKFLFAVVSTVPAKCHVCGTEAKTVALHPARSVEDSIGGTDPD